MLCAKVGAVLTHVGGSIGIEYSHIPDRLQCDWLRERIEIPNRYQYSKNEKKIILDRLIWSDSFERFVSTKYPSEKRFGLEGCESLIPGMKALVRALFFVTCRCLAFYSSLFFCISIYFYLLSPIHLYFFGFSIFHAHCTIHNHSALSFCSPHFSLQKIDKSVENGVDSIVMGMPHRGRLNVLSNVVRKPNESLFCEFSGSLQPGVEGSGDVKYHLGMNYVRPTPSGKRVHLSLAANPSHLEAVNPVVEGKVRAQQFYSHDEAERNSSMALLLHGDASFAAQGVIYETFGFSDLPHYTTGGTIHIVVNNQIGFTTDPRFARSTPYCTDVAKTVHAPILHVNGDDVEAVVFCCQLAADWRRAFKSDVVIDIVCYRRHGHNEIDQPSFTQPLMYKKIAKQLPVIEKYSQELIEETTFSAAEIEANKREVWEKLEASYKASKDYKATRGEWVSSSWEGWWWWRWG